MPEKMDINGILVLDKPAGCTSNAALQKVRKLFSARKAGHTGSLDPQATGVLPLCFGYATRISSFLLEADKAYRAVCRLGVTTTTADACGEVLSEKPVPGFSSGELESILCAFRGTGTQVPPMHSALRHKGQRLYKLARKGIEVQRTERTITIYELVLENRVANDLELYVSCSKGTYIRTLAEDIGKKLGCGAHLAALRRLKAGPFADSDMVSMEEIEGADMSQRVSMLLPVDSALLCYPKVVLNDTLKKLICHGNPVLVPRAPTSGLVRLYDDNSELFALGRIMDDGKVAPGRMLCASGRN